MKKKEKKRKESKGEQEEKKGSKCGKFLCKRCKSKVEQSTFLSFPPPFPDGREGTAAFWEAKMVVGGLEASFSSSHGSDS